LTQTYGRQILFCITCRDIYWDFFEDPSWEEYIYLQARGVLYNFSESEFRIALDKYLKYFHIECDLVGDAFIKCQQPLLLRFFCEAYGTLRSNTVKLGLISEIRLKKLFDDYWGRKISSTREVLGYRTTRVIEEFLYNIARYFRVNKSRSIPLTYLPSETQLKDLESNQSLYVRILDEDIILEQLSGAEKNVHVTFVYDEFMEYTIAREIVNKELVSHDQNMSQQLKSIFRANVNYSSFYNIAVYLCLMLAMDKAIPVWGVVLQLGGKWHKTIARALGQLSPEEFNSDAFNTLVALSAINDDQIQEQVLYIANRLGDKNTFDLGQLWENLFFRSSNMIRIQASQALVMIANRGDKKALAILRSALKHRSPTMRGCAVYSLGQIDNPPYETLLRMFDDHDSLVREAAAFACRGIRDKAVFHKLLEDPDVYVRAEAVLSIVPCNDPRSLLKLLFIATNDLDTLIRRDARNTILKSLAVVDAPICRLLFRELDEIEYLDELTNQDDQNINIPWVHDLLSYWKEENLILEPKQITILPLENSVNDFEITDEDGPFELIDYLASEDEFDKSSVISSATYNILREVVGEVLNGLPPREVRVVQLYYGLLDGQCYTYEQISRKMSTSDYYVRNALKQALSRLRHPSIRRKLRDFLIEF
jgi:hypothetical protein